MISLPRNAFGIRISVTGIGEKKEMGKLLFGAVAPGKPALKRLFIHRKPAVLLPLGGHYKP